MAEANGARPTEVEVKVSAEADVKVRTAVGGNDLRIKCESSEEGIVKESTEVEVKAGDS